MIDQLLVSLWNTELRLVNHWSPYKILSCDWLLPDLLHLGRNDRKMSLEVSVQKIRHHNTISNNMNHQVTDAREELGLQTLSCDWSIHVKTKLWLVSSIKFLNYRHFIFTEAPRSSGLRACSSLYYLYLILINPYWEILGRSDELSIVRDKTDVPVVTAAQIGDDTDDNDDDYGECHDLTPLRPLITLKLDWQLTFNLHSNTILHQNDASICFGLVLYIFFKSV